MSDTPRVQITPLVLRIVLRTNTHLQKQIRRLEEPVEVRQQIRSSRRGLRADIERREPDAGKAQQEAADLLFLETAKKLRDEKFGKPVGAAPAEELPSTDHISLTCRPSEAERVPLPA